jgi:hypothetical protein
VLRAIFSGGSFRERFKVLKSAAAKVFFLHAAVCPCVSLWGVTGEPEASLKVGDVVLTGGLSSEEYNGLAGEVKSALVEGRYQVNTRQIVILDA